MPGPLRPLLAALCLLPAALAGTPILVLQNHTGAVLEGDNLTLECVSQEGEDMSGYTFQRYSQWMQSWVNVDRTNRYRCWYYDVNITREDGRLLLHIEDIQAWHTVPYRCVYTGGSNSTDPENLTASENITIPVHYLRHVYLSRTGSWCGTVGPLEFVDEGSDVELSCRAQSDGLQEPSYEWSREGDDWIEASRVLKLKKVGPEAAGVYTCQARHPFLSGLVKTQSVKLDVVKPQRVRAFDSLFSGSSTSLAVFIGVPAVVLLLVALTIGLVIRKRKAASREKPLIEEPEQRSPIYKGSQESLPSRAGDTQPLVI